MNRTYNANTTHYQMKLLNVNQRQMNKSLKKKFISQKIKTQYFDQNFAYSGSKFGQIGFKEKSLNERQQFLYQTAIKKQLTQSYLQSPNKTYFSEQQLAPTNKFFPISKNENLAETQKIDHDKCFRQLKEKLLRQKKIDREKHYQYETLCWEQLQQAETIKNNLENSLELFPELKQKLLLNYDSVLRTESIFNREKYNCQDIN